ncbi:MAG: beta-galactosidase [Planctomycetota bacterium]|nr:beta-galactosidase [Planctomycetota bacterium]
MAVAASLPFALAAEDHAPPLRIELEADTVKEGDVLRGSLTGTWADEHRSEEKRVLRLVWIDGVGRAVNHVEIAREKHAAPGEPIAFGVAVNGGLGRAHKLVALVASRPRKKSDEPGDWRVAAEAPFRIDRAPAAWDGFTVLAPGHVDAKHWARLEALGVQGLAPLDPHNGKNAARLAELDLPFLADGLIPAAQNALRPPDAKAWMEKVRAFASTRDEGAFGAASLFDETLLAQAREAAKARLAEHAWLSPLGYSLGDGLALARAGDPAGGRCDEATLEIFRAWLSRTYGSLADLNKAWSTTFPRWEEVRPPTTDEVKAEQDPRYAERLAWLRNGDPEKKLPRHGKVPYFTLKLSETAAPGGENFAAWCDWRAFQDFAFARVLHEYATWVREGDPGARVGLTGTRGPSAWSGYDWSRVAAALDWCSPEGPDAALQRGLLRSFHAGAGTLALLEPGASMRRALWDGWLRGDAGAMLGKADRLLDGRNESKDLLRALEEDLKTLSGGLALQRARMNDARGAVAIYYSPRSLALHWLLDSRLDGSDWVRRTGDAAADRDSGLAALRAWHALLEDLGYRPVFVDARMLLAGQVKAQALILPKVLALSDAEADAIRSYARLGGLVMADSQCGVFDGHGRRRGAPHRDDGAGAAAGALDEAFGIRRLDFWAHEFDGTFHGDGQEARVFLEDPMQPVRFGPVSGELRVNEPGLRAAGAWRYGRTLTGLTGVKEDGTAALLVRPAGLGRFVYLNLAMQSYAALREQAGADFALTGCSNAEYERAYGAPTGGESLRVLIGDMLGESLARARVQVRSPEGQPLRGIDRLCWSHGAASLIALLPPANEPAEVSLGHGALLPANRAPYAPREARVVLAERRHWYDLRAGTYLGLGNACPVELTPDRASVLAALPYKVEALHTKVRRTHPLGVFHVWASLETGRGEDGGEPGTHVLRLEVYDPQGRHLPHYGQNLTAERGVWEGTLALGLNEPAGTYRALIRDVLSGKSEEAHLLKDGVAYEALFPARLAEQRWTAEPAEEAGRLALEGDALVYRRRVRLTAEGQGLTAPPRLDIRAPKPWSFEHFEMPVGALESGDPTPAPLDVDLVLRTRRRDLKPEAPQAELVYETPEGEARLAFPLRIALVPEEERGGIEIDGKLGDKGWGRAPQAAGFCLADGEADASRAPEEETAVYLRRSETHLLIGVRCDDRAFEENQAEKVRAEDRDDEALSEGDWFEVAVAVESEGKPAGAPVRVRIDPRGQVLDARGKDIGWNLSDEAHAAAQAGKKGWSAELSIPWKDLGLEKAPDEGTGLRLGFERRRVTGPETAERSLWRNDALRPASDPAALGLAMTVGK